MEEWMYRSTFSWPRHLLELSGQLRSGGKSLRYPLDRRLGGPQSRYGRRGENSWPYRDSNSDPVVSRCTGYIIAVSDLKEVQTLMKSISKLHDEACLPAVRHTNIPYVGIEPVGKCRHPIGWLFSVWQWSFQMVMLQNNSFSYPDGIVEAQQILLSEATLHKWFSFHASCCVIISYNFFIKTVTTQPYYGQCLVWLCYMFRLLIAIISQIHG
jgi:hypothetical protein